MSCTSQSKVSVKKPLLQSTGVLLSLVLSLGASQRLMNKHTGIRGNLVIVGPKRNITLNVNSPPDNSTAWCESTPPAGVYDGTLFMLNCSNFSDPHEPLRYRFERYDFDRDTSASLKFFFFSF